MVGTAKSIEYLNVDAMTNINGQRMSIKSMAEHGKESVTAMFKNIRCVRCVKRMED